jgi:hypothetical protein
MRSLVKFLLVWLVVLAIPLQGMAATTMLLCGPAHHRAQQGVSPAAMHGSHGPAHESTQAIDGTTTHVGHGVSGATEDPAPEWAADSAVPMDAAQFTCSACASCCSPAAIPQSVAALAASDNLFAPVAAPGPGRFSVVIDAPDRPPRAFLA